MLSITSFECHSNSSIAQNVKERMGRVSEEFLADWIALTFISDVFIHIRAVPVKALKDWAAGGQMSMEVPFSQLMVDLPYCIWKYLYGTTTIFENLLCITFLHT